MNKKEIKRNRLILIISLIVLYLIPVAIFAQDIFAAVKKNDMLLVKSLIEINPELLISRDIDGRTLLHWAARSKPANQELMELLINRGIDIDARDKNGIVALFSVLSRRQYNAAMLLVNRGANVRVRDNDLNTPLHYAIEYAGASNVKDLVKLIISKGADLNAKNNEENTPLMCVNFSVQRELAELLVAYGTEVPVLGNKAREILHDAASSGCWVVVDLMLKRGIDPTTNNNNGGTLFHSAAEGGIDNLISDLTKKKLDINASDRYTETPLHYATSRGHSKVVQVLLKNGANPDKRNALGQSALNIAKEKRFKKIVDILITASADLRPAIFEGTADPYFGQKRPQAIPELFAPGIVSTRYMEHSSFFFSPDGSEIYWFTNLGSDSGELHNSRWKDDSWTTPQVLELSLQPSRCDYALSPDGESLYFCSRYSPEGNLLGPEYRIWVVDKLGNEWSQPRELEMQLNTIWLERMLHIDKDGKLYFVSNQPSGKGGLDIYTSNQVCGKFGAPELLGDSINTEHSEECPFISRDGSYMIFSSDRPGGYGESDLYISFRQKDGLWSYPSNLGPEINSKAIEWYPSISPDGKYLFFNSNRNGNFDIYWVDAKVVEELRPKNLK